MRNYSAIELEAIINERVEEMSDEELYSYIPREFIVSAVKGFLAGELVKKYVKDSWKDADLCIDDMYDSMYRHYLATKYSLVDPDTGLKDSGIFLSARAVMIATLLNKPQGDANT
jgi:hypothetical protein